VDSSAYLDSRSSEVISWTFVVQYSFAIWTFFAQYSLAIMMRQRDWGKDYRRYSRQQFYALASHADILLKERQR